VVVLRSVQIRCGRLDPAAAPCRTPRTVAIVAHQQRVSRSRHGTRGRRVSRPRPRVPVTW